MNFSNLKTHSTLAAILAGLVLLSACSDDDNDNKKTPTASYKITVDNLTNGQPMTPLGVIVHGAGYMPWQEGSSASTGLEMLAEGGDPGAFLSEADANTEVSATMASENGPFLSGTSESVTVTVEEDTSLLLSLATMLANTNDAFTGVNSVRIGNMVTGDTMTIMAPALDAGTEVNSEAMGTIPGPADSGEGFNAARESSDIVTIHRGIVSLDDGLITSVLREGQRWQNPVARVTIERVE